MSSTKTNTKAESKVDKEEKVIEKKDKKDDKKVEKKEKEPEDKKPIEKEDDDNKEEVEVEVEEEEEKKESRKIVYEFVDIETAYTDQKKSEDEVIYQSRLSKEINKQIKKYVSKELKKTKKHQKKEVDPTKEKNGFVKAKPVPENFETFYGTELKDDEKFKESFPDFDISKELPRTEVTKIIYWYIGEHNLYVKDKEKKDGIDKRRMVPNDALKTMFDIVDEEEITFNNFQKYVSLLYPSKEEAEGDEKKEDKEDKKEKEDKKDKKDEKKKDEEVKDGAVAKVKDPKKK